MEVSSMITLASAREGVAYAFWNTLEDAEQDAKVSSMITLASAREGVAYAFWSTLEDAEQDAAVAKWEEKIDERAKEIED